MEGSILGVPLIVLVSVAFGVVLFAAIFKLDSLVSLPKESSSSPLAGGLDEKGMPIFLEPDGRPLNGKKKK